MDWMGDGVTAVEAVTYAALFAAIFAVSVSIWAFRRGNGVVSR